MKQIFTLNLFIALIFITGCSKEVLKKYDKRIIGTWRIAAVNKIGIGGDRDNLPFRRGNFTFREDGTLTYTDATGTAYQGNWDISKKLWRDEDIQRTLQISVVNFGTQEILTEYYDDMTFWGTDHFKASTVIGLQTFVTHFRR